MSVALTLAFRFLMARLYLDTLINKTTRRKIKSALDTLPEGIHGVYEELMTRIKLQNPRDHVELAIRVLRWIFYVARPLTVDEIQHALATEHGDSDLDRDGIPNRDLLISVCAGMVMINDGSDTITLVHFTTQEYFQQSGKHLLGPANFDIASTCLNYLKFDALDDQILTCSTLDHASILPLLSDYPLLPYAAQHWGPHLRESYTTASIFQKDIDDLKISEYEDMALEILEDERKVSLLVWIMDYSNHKSRGTYFRERSQVYGLALASTFGLNKLLSRLIDSRASGSLDLNEVDSNGQNALHHAVLSSYTDTADVLLRAGAEINFKDTNGWTALHIASVQGDLEMVKLLFVHGADINLQDGYNATPLYRAAEHGAERVVKLLLSKGADVSTSNKYLQTALHRAADMGHIAVVELLLRAGADANGKDYFGFTPIYIALDQGHDDVVQRLRCSK